MGGQRMGKNRRGILYLLVMFFTVLLVIPVIMVFESMFEFEKKAQGMTDAMKIAEIFKKDYLLALYAPVNHITVCQQLPNINPCIVTISSPQAGSIADISAPHKYAPTLSVGIEDPPFNATTFLDLTVYGKYPAGTSLDIIEPRINSSSCTTETVDSVEYRRCRLNCTIPIKITKIRHYNPAVGVAGAVIDNISVEQGAGGC